MTAKKLHASQRQSRRSNNIPARPDLSGLGGGGTAGIVVENVNHPGSSRLVDAAMYRAPKESFGLCDEHS